VAPVYARQQTMALVLRGLEEAFTTFGGVPRELLFDQLKSVVVKDHRDQGGKLLANREFLRFAHHWTFRIRACRPYRAQTNGKVERPVRYARDNFVYGREFWATRISTRSSPTGSRRSRITRRRDDEGGAARALRVRRTSVRVQFERVDARKREVARVFVRQGCRLDARAATPAAASR
jgi:transposase